MVVCREVEVVCDTHMDVEEIITPVVKALLIDLIDEEVAEGRMYAPTRICDLIKYRMGLRNTKLPKRIMEAWFGTPVTRYVSRTAVGGYDLRLYRKKIVKHTKGEVLGIIEKTLKEHPEVGANGLMSIGDPELKSEQEYFVKKWEEVADCMLYISLFVDKIKGECTSSSYGLKHTVERWVGSMGNKAHGTSYVTNGSFILAALALGYTIKSSHGLNAVFNMKISNRKLFTPKQEVAK